MIAGWPILALFVRVGIDVTRAYDRAESL